MCLLIYVVKTLGNSTKKLCADLCTSHYSLEPIGTDVGGGLRLSAALDIFLAFLNETYYSPVSQLMLAQSPHKYVQASRAVRHPFLISPYISAS